VKLLVTGAAGFLGTAVVGRLLAHGYTDIRCHVRQQANIPKLEALSRRYAHARVEHCVGNLKYRDDVARAVDGVQLIFHLAAGKKGAAADLFLDSVVASRNLLDAIADRKPMRIVLVSSFAVYGIAGLGPGAQVNEHTALEQHPEWRDHYSHTKLRQEQLFWEYQQRSGFELAVLRPGVVYGPGGGHVSNRVGLTIGNWHFDLGGSNLLPLTYVDNCAEAVVVAGTTEHAVGQVYNVHDDDLPTCREYLSAYKKQVKKVRSISVPRVGLQLLSSMLAKYHRYSKGQLPAILTPYKVANLWAGNRFDNSKLHSIGWKQLVPTAEGLRRSFAAFRSELDPATVRKPFLPDGAINPADGQTEEFRHGPDEFVIGVVLSRESNGNFDHLLAAFSNLRKTGRPARLVIFGARDMQHPVNGTADQELRADIHRVSDESNTRNSLQGCDVLISLQKGVPLLVLQAMSSGIPVITTAVRVPEVLQHQRTAIVVRRGDWCTLQETLQELADDPERRLFLGAHALKSVATRYSRSYLWRTSSPQATNEPPTLIRRLIKRALFAAVPKPHIIRHGNRERPEIALTIDDGPDPFFTPRILDICRHYKLKATFFVVGGCAEQYPELLLRMDREGHEIGNHSYSHPYFNKLTWRAAAEEIEMTRSVLDSLVRKKCELFRPPSGKLSLYSLIPAWEAGQHVTMWTVDLKDYGAKTGEVEAKLARTNLSAGDVVLYHGKSDAALHALPQVIEAALGRGLKPVTISELIRR
jgi:nucleoside-diphosphate-sugar epimerase/peptidoglycan/xylan/chitin deacetylase (PgdA/CDA1 family)